MIKILCATVVVILPMVPLWLIFITGDVQANGRTIQILKNTEGPYLVEVRSSHPSPTIGNVHFNIVLWTLEENVPVNDASVTVKAVRLEHEPSIQGPIHTYNPPTNANSYEFNIELPKEGDWMFIVDILHMEKLTSFEFPLKVHEIDDTLAPMLIFLGSIITIGTLTWIIRIHLPKYLSHGNH